jgi:hypothetical protein
MQAVIRGGYNGVNAMRDIRRKDEQVFLAPVPRGYKCSTGTSES